jgi:hypothetical protein
LPQFEARKEVRMKNKFTSRTRWREKLERPQQPKDPGEAAEDKVTGAETQIPGGRRVGDPPLARERLRVCAPSQDGSGVKVFRGGLRFK